jgi:GNAT superfamily N-acetyltransferase
MEAAVILPATLENWPLVAGLFSSKGCPSYCWCLTWRAPDAHILDSKGKAQKLRSFLERGVPIGVIAVEQDEAVGWCSAAPRASFARLDRSRTMPAVSKVPTWTINCLFVKRDWRGHGVARGLVQGAVTFARDSGAFEIEAYPYDTAGVSSTHQGRSDLYSACGFVPGDGRRWFRKLQGE